MSDKTKQLAQRLAEWLTDSKLPPSIIEGLLTEKDPTGTILLGHVLKSYKLESGIQKAVELYYDSQFLRIAHKNKEKNEDPRDLTEWFARYLELGEKVIKQKLQQWIESEQPGPEAKWAYKQVGIGPVIAAGLASHINLEKGKSASSLWRFAGFDPNHDKPVKGEPLPYNRRLKVLCWKLGESFVKVSGNEKARYGGFYAQFKAQEISRNEAGQYAEQAKHQLTIKDWKRDTTTKKRLLEGKLSDAHIHSRATRRTVKLFLAHYWVVGRTLRNLPVRDPWIQTYGGHDPDGIIPPEF